VDLVYIDDSGDDRWHVFSALFISDNRWHECFNLIKQFRTDLRQSDGFYLSKEIHARDLTAGRGNVAKTPIIKVRRNQILLEILTLITQLPEVRMINSCFPRGQDAIALSTMLTRVHTNVERRDCRAVIYMDEGKNGPYTRIRRRMAVYNPIPSAYDTWPDGSKYKNIPITEVVEDLTFKDSQRSHFIQLADCAAFALLRSENPTTRAQYYGIDQGFDLLKSVLVTEANGKDPRKLGILRPK
jgi:Protein of unknown function (DUF3800)